MSIVLALFGLFIGAWIAELSGALSGAMLGAVLGLFAAHFFRLKQQVADLARTIEELRTRVHSLAGRAAQTSVPATQTLAAQTPADATETALAQPIPTRPTLARPAVAERTEVESAPAPSSERKESLHDPEGELASANSSEGLADARSDSARDSTEYEEFASIRKIREFLLGGNTVVRLSIAILFVGIALLLKYASDQGHLSIEVRLIGVSVAALAMLVFGWRLRGERAGYAIAMQGGATAVLYLIIFFALRTYSLLPAGMAFALLLAVVVLSAALAVLQNALWLALIGISGGFLAPILTSTGHGSHVALFTFYAVLNVGVVAIAWFKAWRPLNVVGFAFTFVIGTLWGVQRYVPALFASTEPFLVLFFLMYLSIAVLFAARQAPNLKGYVDGTLVFGTPIAAFALQSAMLYDRRYWLSFSALTVSVLYMTLAWSLWRRRASWRLLAESFLALSVAFATLAIPLALDGRWSAATWALEGAALLWVGCRQSQFLPRMAGIALQFAAAVMFMRDREYFFTGLPILNSTCLGALLIASAGVYGSRLLRYYKEKVSALEQAFSGILFFWGLAWWLTAGIGEIERLATPGYTARGLLAFFALTSLACSELHRRMDIEAARFPPLWLLPLLVVFAGFEWLEGMQPFARYGWLTWPLAGGVFYFTLRRHETVLNPRVAAVQHIVAAWLLMLLASRELAWTIDYWVEGAGSWPAIAWAIVPAGLLMASRRMERWLQWPVAAHVSTYLGTIGGSFAVYLVAWSLFTSVTRDGNAHPLPYVPLLNPLDLAQALVLLAGFMWFRHSRKFIAMVTARDAVVAGGIVVFVWLNAILLRTIHYRTGVPYEPNALWQSTLVQAWLSIFWMVLALAAMLTATRRGLRVLWWVGAALMIVVIAKLFVIDMSKVGSIARIISFIGVGLLMLVIGYFSPLPPKEKSA